MKKWIVFTLLLALILSGCSEEEADKGKSDIYQVRAIGMLSTSEYTVGKILRVNDKGDWYDWGERKILISCKAKIKAGINLKKIADSDITVDGNKIEIKLPPPEIISFEMDPDQVKTEMVDVSGLRANFSQDDKHKILKLGEQSIKKDMLQLDILKDAQANAVAFLKDFYETLGYEEVIIHVTTKD